MAHERLRPASPLTARLVLWITLLFLYVPIAVMILGAVFEKTDSGWAVSLKWFQEVFADESMMQALSNSLIVAVSSSILSTVIGTMAALALYRSAPGIRKVMQSLSLVSLIFPEIVFALSLLSWFFVLRLELGLTTVIIAHVSFSLSYVMLTVSSRYATLDASLEEAAKDLGANEGQILRKVTLPLLKPAIVGGFILSFLLSFDDFLITYFVNGVGSDTLPVKLYTAMKLGVSPKLNALSSMMFLITLVILMFFFRTASFKATFEAQEETPTEPPSN